jgi:hypothetical protein
MIKTILISIVALTVFTIIKFFNKRNIIQHTDSVEIIMKQIQHIEMDKHIANIYILDVDDLEYLNNTIIAFYKHIIKKNMGIPYENLL